MQLTAAEIIASPEFAARVAQLVEQTGRTPEDVSADARRCLEEMVATIEPRSTRRGTASGRGSPGRTPWMRRLIDSVRSASSA